MQSRPEKRRGNACFWTGVGMTYPTSSILKPYYKINNDKADQIVWKNNKIEINLRIMEIRVEIAFGVIGREHEIDIIV